MDKKQLTVGLAKVFFWGMIISFLGTLPPGTLNIAAMQMSVQESVKNAVYFSIGTILVEMICVRFSLIGINWIRKQKTLFRWLEWVTFLIVLALAIGSFIAASKQVHTKNIMLNNDTNRFLLGMVLSALSPMHIPFWLGWSTVLFTKGVLHPATSYYNLYIIGIGLGSFLGNCVFIFGGKFIVEKLSAHMDVFNWSIGGIFLLTAIIQFLKILYHKDGAEKLALPAEEEIRI